MTDFDDLGYLVEDDPTPDESVVLAQRMTESFDAELEAELVMLDAAPEERPAARRKAQRTRAKAARAREAWDAYWRTQGVEL